MHSSHRCPRPGQASTVSPANEDRPVDAPEPLETTHATNPAATPVSDRRPGAEGGGVPVPVPPSSAPGTPPPSAGGILDAILSAKS